MPRTINVKPGIAVSFAGNLAGTQSAAAVEARLVYRLWARLASPGDSNWKMVSEGKDGFTVNLGTIQPDGLELAYWIGVVASAPGLRVEVLLTVFQAGSAPIHTVVPGVTGTNRQVVLQDVMYLTMR